MAILAAGLMLDKRVTPAKIVDTAQLTGRTKPVEKKMILAYAIFYLCAVIVSLVVAMLAWQRRATPGARALAGLMLALAVWSLAEAGELLATGTIAKIAWSKFSYVGAATCPTLLLAFVLDYVRQAKFLTPRAMWLRWLFPMLTLLLVFTNDWHGWFWERIAPMPSDLAILGYGHGIWFWVNAVYSYAVIFAALMILANASLNVQHAYRQQAFALLASIVIPLAFNAIYILGFSPIAGLDLSPLAFIVCGLLIAFGIFRLRLLDLVPVARDTLIENLSDGVIVLDARDRIVDLNPAAQKFLNLDVNAIGKDLESFPDFTGVALRSSVSNSEIEIASGWLDVRVAPLGEQGRLVILHDITALKQMQAALAENAILRERQRLARDLHDSVTQSLNSLVLSAYTATNRLKQGKYDRLEISIAQMSDGARQALKEMRLLLYDLRLAPAAQINLVEAIRLRLESVEKRAGIDAQFITTNAPSLTPNVEHELYLITLEALNNSLKHSGANQVVVNLCGAEKTLRLEIKDNGKGFDLQNVRAGGMGLQNLYTRAEKIGGGLTIETAPNQGTCICLHVEKIE